MRKSWTGFYLTDCSREMHMLAPHSEFTMAASPSLGQKAIYVKSGKEKIVTRLSTEPEWVGVSDALSQVLWTQEYLISAGLDIKPDMIYQDNQSTIWLANKGRSTNERSRHIKIRHFFVPHYIESEEILVKCLPTGDMVADVLTKLQHWQLFSKLTGLLTGNWELWTTIRTSALQDHTLPRTTSSASLFTFLTVVFPHL